MRTESLELAGRVAVVTGASSGIGEWTARLLAREGMIVYAAARRADRLDALAEHVAGIRPQRADVTVDADVEALAARVRDEQGACHVLVNNAGFSPHDTFRSFDDVASVAATMDCNFLGAVRCTGAFSDLLAASAPARVINVASMAGKVGAGSAGYVASKFATVGFTEALDRDWRARGVTVSQVNPGFIETEGFPQHDLRAIPLLGRLVGTPDMVAAAILEVARSGQHERTVPRWYRPQTVLRHVFGRVFWAGLSKLPR